MQEKNEKIFTAFKALFLGVKCRGPESNRHVQEDIGF